MFVLLVRDLEVIYVIGIFSDWLGVKYSYYFLENFGCSLVFRSKDYSI